MNRSLKCFLAGAVMLVFGASALQAGQEVYLSTSPNGRYRVLVEQVIDRRIEDRIFFRYPIELVNIRHPQRHFDILDAGSPLIQETDRQTFHVRWEDGDAAEPSSIHFDWAKDSLKFFIHLEAIPGIWKIYFVDVNTGKTREITPELEAAMKDKVDFHGWDCQEPVITLEKWVKPNLAFFKLTSVCGGSRKKENKSLFYQEASVLFDTDKDKVASNCLNCGEKDSLKKFNRYYLSTLPTATPTPEETPVNQ
jgi:hypothetical protein